MTINLNQSCNVILTAHGAEVYNEYFRELHATCKLIELADLKAEDELSLQLWELMSIFGKHLYNGAKNCFANNDISFNDKVVKIPELSREEIKELLANWKGTLLVGNDISLSPWISVEDKLPDDGVLVIVAYRWILGEILYASDTFHIDYGWESYDDIVAWMPIPQLPKEDGV